jgi:hypothetical protein
VTTRTIPALRVIAALSGACFYRCQIVCHAHHEANKLRGLPDYVLSGTCTGDARYAAGTLARLDALNNAMVVVEAQG